MFSRVLQLLCEDRVTCQYAMSSATLWWIQRVQTRSDSTVVPDRTGSSAAEMWQIRSHVCTSVTSLFIHFLIWLSHKAGAPAAPLCPKHPIKPTQSHPLTFKRS